ncbi:hypothetical protein D7193_05835 [Micromonospora costi]|uniref:Secreted protein n=2 Tax=Micromonospora costi TaxID=1530042 RepID=A0A3B0ACS2_9ACTN|nr:hypothetical protein D7193_05835 [Micromonospora costi]
MKVWAGLGAAAVLTGAVVFVANTGSFAADTPPTIEEDFSHPGAERILADHGLKVFKGDGHIWFDTSRSYDTGEQCPVGQIQVEKALDVAPYGVWYCFKTKGTEGYLTLEVPGTFGIRGGSEPLEATANLPEGPKTYQIEPNKPVAISPGTGTEPPKAILVELRLSGAAS